MGIFSKIFKNSAEDEFQNEINSQLSQNSSPTINGITNNTLNSSYPFRFQVEDVFTITGRGTVVTGVVQSGEISINEDVNLKRQNGSSRTVHIKEIEMFRKLCDKAVSGDNVGLLLSDVGKLDISKGDILEK